MINDICVGCTTMKMLEIDRCSTGLENWERGRNASILVYISRLLINRIVPRYNNI